MNVLAGDHVRSREDRSRPEGHRSIIMARDTLTGSVPMDVSAVYKGKSSSKGKGEKGKSSGKGKVQGQKDPAANPDAEMICYFHHTKGQRKRDCMTFEKDKDKKGVNAVDKQTFGAVAAPSGTPSRVSMTELDDWILAVNFDDHEAMVGSTER